MANFDLSPFDFLEKKRGPRPELQAPITADGTWSVPNTVYWIYLFGCGGGDGGAQGFPGGGGQQPGPGGAGGNGCMFYANPRSTGLIAAPVPVNGGTDTLTITIGRGGGPGQPGTPTTVTLPNGETIYFGGDPRFVTRGGPGAPCGAYQSAHGINSTMPDGSQGGKGNHADPGMGPGNWGGAGGGGGAGYGGPGGDGAVGGCCQGLGNEPDLYRKYRTPQPGSSAQGAGAGGGGGGGGGDCGGTASIGGAGRDGYLVIVY